MFTCCCQEQEHDDLLVIESSHALTHDAVKLIGAEVVPLGPLNAILHRVGDESLGLKVDSADGRTFHVCKVHPRPDSPVQLFNHSVSAELRLRKGDYIVSINGAEAAHLMKEELATAPRLEITFVRPVISYHEVVWDRKLGLELNFSQDSSSLVIAEIADGAVKAYAPEIRPGDRIIAVEHLHGNPDELLKLIKRAKGHLMLTVSRCSFAQPPL